MKWKRVTVMNKKQAVSFFILKTAKQARQRAIIEQADKFLIESKDKMTLLYYLEFSESLENIFLNYQKKFFEILDNKNIWSIEKASNKKKKYKTNEYLDRKNNFVIVDDIKDVLIEMKNSLSQAYDKYIINGFFKDKMLTHFSFNSYDRKAAKYLNKKKIKWSKQVSETTDRQIRRELVKGLKKGLSRDEIAQRIRRSTGFSINRCMVIASTEINSAQNYSTYFGFMNESQVKGLRWQSSIDSRTRPTHARANGQIRKKGEPFNVGASKLLFPGDTSLGASAKEVIACRCILQPVFEDESLESSTIYDDKDFGTEEWLYRQDDNFQEDYISSLNLTRDNKYEDVLLTSKEKRAINEYISSGSYVINEKLRNNMKLTQEEKEFSHYLNKALNRFPDYKGNLGRTLKFANEEQLNKFVEKHAKGNIVKYNEFISTTKDDILNEDAEVFIYISDSKKGKDISLFNPLENEVLYKINSRFRVENVIFKDNKHYILLTECKSKGGILNV